MDGKMLAGWIVTTLAVAAVIIAITLTVSRNAESNHLKEQKEWADCVARHSPSECRLAIPGYHRP